MISTYERAALAILEWLHRAEQDLIGRTVVTFNGETGDVRELMLSDHHGLCFTFDPPVEFGRRFYPVSTIKLRN
jgi:hypothetical protein